MLQNQGRVRRTRGRPQIRPDDETRRLVIEAAAQEFQANGYSGTGMGAVAQRAGISTKTLYRLIPAKADMLSLVVTDRIARFILEIDQDIGVAADPLLALERILIAYGSVLLSGESIAINRLIIAESDRFPEIAANFYREAIAPTNAAVIGWLSRQRERGFIRIDDLGLAAGMLRGMMIQEPQRAAMLGQRPPPDAAEIATRAKACARLFIEGCRA